MKEDPERKNRNLDEIIVDAYVEEEQSLGWYNYLHDKLSFPFTARCIAEAKLWVQWIYKSSRRMAKKSM